MNNMKGKRIILQIFSALGKLQSVRFTKISVNGEDSSIRVFRSIFLSYSFIPIA